MINKQQKSVATSNRVSQPATTTGKAAKSHRSQFSQAQHLRRSRSKQVSLGGNTNLLSAEQIATLSVDQIIAKYKIGQTTTSQQQQAARQHSQSHQSLEVEAKMLPQHRIKSSRGQQETQKARFASRKLSHEIEQPQALQYRSYAEPEQNNRHHLGMPPHQEVLSDFPARQHPQQQSLKQQHMRNRPGYLSYGGGTPQGGGASMNESFIHNQVFKALDKILTKAKQPVGNNYQSVQHPPVTVVGNQQQQDRHRKKIQQVDTFAMQTPEAFDPIGASAAPQYHSNHQAPGSNNQQIYYSNQTHQMQQPLVQLNSSYLLPQAPPMTGNKGGHIQQVQSSAELGGDDIQLLKTSTQALSKEVNEMRNAIQAIRQSEIHTAEMSHNNGSLPSAIRSNSNVPSSRVSPESIKKQGGSGVSVASTELQTRLETAQKERDDALAKSERLQKESVAHKYTVQSLRDQIDSLESEKSLLETQLSQVRTDLRSISSPKVELPREIHSPQGLSGPQRTDFEETIRKLQADCQMLSTTVKGQAGRIKALDQLTESLQDEISHLKVSLGAKEDELTELQTVADGLREQQKALQAEVPSLPQVEIKEVVKYVDKYIEAECTQCDEAQTQIATLKGTVAELEAAQASLQEKLETDKTQLLAQLESLAAELQQTKETAQEQQVSAQKKIADLEQEVAKKAVAQPSQDVEAQMAKLKQKYEVQVKRMDQRLGDAVKKIKELNLDIDEYKEIEQHKEQELKELQEQKTTLIQLKGKKNPQQQVIDQLNAQIEKDVAQIMEGRMREATLNKLIAKMQNEIAEMRTAAPAATTTAKQQ